MRRAQYLAMRNELASMIHEYGFSFRVRKRKPLWNNETPYQVRGSFSWHQRRILVTCYGRMAYSDVLYFLAHETRHLLHAVNGMFYDYYDERNFSNIRKFMRGKDVEWRWPNLGVATRAERECDRWARKWLADKGVEIHPRWNALYPHYQTYAYGVSQRLKRFIAIRELKEAVVDRATENRRQRDEEAVAHGRSPRRNESAQRALRGESKPRHPH